MRIPIVAIYHDLTYFGGLEVSETDLVKKLSFAGYKVIFAHKSQYFTYWDTIKTLSKYAKIVDINEEDIECDIIIYSSLVFPFWEINDKIKTKHSIGWLHFIPSGDYSLVNDKRFMDGIDRLICVSKTNMKHVINRFPDIDKSKMRVIHNSMDVDKIIKLSKEPVDNMPGKDILKFVHVCRISEGKGSSKCVDLAKKCEANKNIGKNYKIYMIGDGAGDKFHKKLTNDIKSYNIEWVGYQENPYKYISKCDYGFLPTWGESWCLFVDECWLLGIPTITTNFEALHERMNYKDYCITCDKDIKTLSIKEVLDKKDTLKNNLKGWKFENEYDKWVEEFTNLFKK